MKKASSLMLLQKARLERGLTQQQVADLLQVTVDSVRGWERGRHAPSPAFLPKLSELLGLSLEELGLDIGEEDAETGNLASERANRRRLIQRVRNTWINGVLQESLHSTSPIELGLQERPDALTNPWRLEVQETDVPERQLPPGTTLEQLYDIADGELLILGDPGAGKTTSLLELARVLLIRAEKNRQFPIPVVFHLSSWSPKFVDLIDWLVQVLESKYYLPKAIAQEWLRTERIALFLDGLDETADELRLPCVNAIKKYQHKHVSVPIVLCCRSEQYFALPTRFELQKAVLIQPLTREQITEFLDRAGRRLRGVRYALEHDKELFEMMKNPLMLSIIGLAYAYEGTSSATLRFAPSQSPEERRQMILQAYIERTLNRRSVTRYQPAQTIQRLSWLAGRMKAHGMSEFYLEHMQPDWLQDQSTIQRYRLTVTRCVIVITALVQGGIVALFRGDSVPTSPGLFFWLGGGYGNSLLEWMAPGLSNWLRGATGMLLINGIVSILIATLGNLGRIPPISKQAIIAGVTNTVRYGLPASILFGICAGFLYRAMNGNGAAIHGIVDGLFAGYAVGLTQGLGTLLRFHELKKKTFRLSLRSRFLNGLLAAFCAFCAFTLLYAWQSGAINTLTIFYGIVIGCLFGIVLVLNIGIRQEYDQGTFIRPAEKADWSWRTVWQNAGETLRKGIQLGVLLLLFALIGTIGMSSFSYGPNYGLRYGLIYGLVVGSIASVAGMIVGILTSGWSSDFIDDRRQFARPNEGIRRSLRNALFAAGVFGPIGGIASGLVSGVAFWASGIHKWYILGLGFAVVFTLQFAVQFFLLYGGIAFLEHVLLRWYLWRKNVIAWRFVAFLDYASSRILLRKLGGGYIFIHRLLLEHFAQKNMQKGQ